MASFYLPVRVITGDGCFTQLGDQAAALGHKALVVCGSSAVRSGALEQGQKSLRQANVASQSFTAVHGEPTLDTVTAAVEVARDFQANVIVGLGGGSSIDVAKAAAGLAQLEGTVQDYFYGRAVDGPSLPWIAVPTTSGTGAEVTMNAVLADAESCTKQSIRSEFWFARVALVDPLLTVSAPASVTAYSGADALCQAIEPFVSTGAMPVTDALCRDAIRLIGRSLVKAYRDGGDLSARRDMHYGSLMAGMALTSARLGAVHGMAHPLGCRHRLAHGLVCGILLPHVIEWNLAVAAERYAEIAELLGVWRDGLSVEAAARAGLERVRNILREIGIPNNLAEAGVQAVDYDAVAAESMSSSMKHNPRNMSEDDVVRFLRRLVEL